MNETSGQWTMNAGLFQWIVERQKSLDIVTTTTTPSGQVLDWIPIQSQRSDGQIEVPPPDDDMPDTERGGNSLVRAATFELFSKDVSRGPKGTVPILRPNISRANPKTSLSQYLSKRGGLHVNRRRPNMRPSDPIPFGYFHAVDGEAGTAYGCDGIINIWNPTINIPDGRGYDRSTLQTWIQNYDNSLTQSLEAGWTVDSSLNGNSHPHFFTYYTTNGFLRNGEGIGGYNRVHGGWVQHSAVIYPGMRIVDVSSLGGEQFEFSLKVQLFRGNWWIGVQGIWMGYYPATLFREGLGIKADWIGFGGEVHSSLPDPTLTKDQMGSGRKPQDGWTFAAYQRNLRSQIDASGTMRDNAGIRSIGGPSGQPNPYDIQLHGDSGSDWRSYLYVGGQPATEPDHSVPKSTIARCGSARERLVSTPPRFTKEPKGIVRSRLINV